MGLQPSQFLVISGINMGSNCGYRMVEGTSNVDDYTVAAEACLPIIDAILAEIKNKTYPQKCFLNVDLPTNVANHKGYKLTKQGKCIIKVGWRQVTSAEQGGKMLSTMEANSLTSSEVDASSLPPKHRLFEREVRGRGGICDEDDTDYRSSKEARTPSRKLEPAFPQVESTSPCHVDEIISTDDMFWVLRRGGSTTGEIGMRLSWLQAPLLWK